MQYVIFVEEKHKKTFYQKKQIF